MVRQSVRFCLAQIIFFCFFFGYSEKALFSQETASNPHVRMLCVQKVYERDKPISLLVQLILPDGDHTYGQYPGDVGVAPSFHWQLPSGFVLKELVWPKPRSFQQQGISYFGYEGTVTWEAILQTDDDVPNGPYVIGLDLSWIECGTMCIPREVSLQEKVTIDTHVSHASQEEPGPKIDTSFVTGVTGSSIQEKGLMGTFIERGIWYFLLIGFIGGLLLNIMPCVLPVIGLKVMHQLSDQKRSYFSSLYSSFMYTLGILTTFWALTVLLFFLQRADARFGWGFQLQNPYFVIGLMLVFLVISANLFGLFECGTAIASWAQGQDEGIKGQEKNHSYLVSFASGMLTTLVATPCTGPLLGAIIGFTTSFTLLQSLVLFSAIGLGMASPFFLSALIPIPLLSWILPKPGSWMNSLKQLLGFLLFGCAVWLIWVLSALVSPLVYELLFLGIVLLFCGLWFYGKSQMHPNSFVGKVAFLCALLLSLAGSSLIVASSHTPLRNTLSSFFMKKELRWQSFSFETLKREVDAGNIVLVDATARWCLTCQLNDLVFSQESVRTALEEARVVLLRADWTKQDPDVTQWLHSIQRNGVPALALYKKGRDVVLLPELLSPESIQDGINEFDESHSKGLLHD